MAVGLHYSLRALGGTMGAQWERERRETLFLMLPVALSVLPHLPHLPWWTSAGFFVLFAWRLLLVLSGRWLPRASVRWVAAIACTAAVYAHYQTLLGREPGVALLVLFLGLKLMEMRARRDLFVVIFLCFFLLLSAFFHSQSIATALAVVAALYGLLAAMLTMQFRQHETPIGQRLRSVGLMLAQALPIAAAVFLLFPRFGGPLWGMSADTQRARTGLSDAMTPGNIAQLSESDAIAFRVLFDGATPPTALLYWRGPVFGSFDGQAWRAHDARSTPAGATRLEFGAQGESFRYTVTQEATDRNWLFALEMPARAESDSVRPILRPDLQLVSPMPIVGRLRMTVVSVTDFRAGIDEDATSLRSWLALPAGFNPRTIGMAARWRDEAGAAPGADERLVERALQMFRQQPFRYTLEPPLLGRDSVDDFLFESRAGFCEHYASAFAVLMRALGIPARIVTGYQGGERNPVDGYWLVRQADAHAWAEVWVAGRGWVRVDPTAAVAPQRIERGLRLGQFASGQDLAARSLARRLWFNLDAIGNAWNQWVLSYDRNRQQSLLARLGVAASDWRQLAALLAGVLAALIGAVAVLTLRPHLPRDPVVQAYESFCLRLAAVGLGRARHETASRHLARIARALDDVRLAEARRIVAAYERLRYAEAAPDRAAVRHLRKSVQAFKP